MWKVIIAIVAIIAVVCMLIALFQPISAPSVPTFKPRILYLIIYNPQSEYDCKMKKVLEQYVHNFDWVTTYFIALKPLETECIFDGDVLYFNGTESYIPGILTKSIKAIQLFHHQFDYVLRSNISTVINLEKLTALLSPTDNGIYGSTAMIRYVGISHFGTKFASGTNIILDKKSVEFLLQNLDKLEYSVIDDVAIGSLMKKNTVVEYKEYPGFVWNRWVGFWNPMQIARDLIWNINGDFKNVVVYRNKSYDRLMDVEEMQKFVDYLLHKHNPHSPY